MSTINFDKMPRKLWEHPDRENTIMWRFMKDANRKYNLNLKVRIPISLSLSHSRYQNTNADLLALV